MRVKPPDCQCEYPHRVMRNMTGHSESCPAHWRILGEIRDNLQQSNVCDKCGKPYSSHVCMEKGTISD